MFKQILLIKFD